MSYVVLIDGHDTFRKVRVHGRGGGVCAFVSAGIPCKRRQDGKTSKTCPLNACGFSFDHSASQDKYLA